MNIISDIIQSIKSFLRFFISPIVGLTIVTMFDEKHDVLVKIIGKNWFKDLFYNVNYLSNETLLLFFFILILGVVGILAYFFHRIFIHPPIVRYIIVPFVICIARKKEKNKFKPNYYDLAFERFYRRGCNKEKNESKEFTVQSQLDYANAAGHFFYCNCWSSLIILVLFNVFLSDVFKLSNPFFFVTTILSFFIISLISEYQTTRWDLEAYWRLKKN